MRSASEAPGAGMVWYWRVLGKYADFEGRAGRHEYWYYFLVTVLISVALALVDEFAGLTRRTGGIAPLSSLYALLVFIPGLAVTVRRLHDTAHGSAWIWAMLGPALAGLLLLGLTYAVAGVGAPSPRNC